MISRTKKPTITVPEPSQEMQETPVAEGQSLLEEAVKEPTLDRFLNGNPKIINSDADYLKLIDVLRKNRAAFITAETKRREKKEGIESETEEG